LNFHRVDSRRLFALSIVVTDDSETHVSNARVCTMPARVGVCQSLRLRRSTDRNERLHNVTNAARRSEQQTWTMRVRVHVHACRGKGRWEWRNRQRRRERKKERQREKKKRDRTATERRDIHHALTNSASIARACARVYGRTWMCAEKRILPSTVERTRASSCQRTPPRKPLWNQPHPSWWNPRLPSSCHRLFPLTSRFSIPLRTIPPPTVTTSRNYVPCTKAKVTRARIDANGN